MNLDKQKIKIWLPTIIWGSVIFLFSSISNVPDQIGDLPYFDKFFHLGEFTIFGFLLFRSFKFSLKNNTNLNILLLTVVLGTFFAASDEMYQFFVPNRMPDLKDLIVDSFGCILGSHLFLNRNFIMSKFNFLKKKGG